MSDGTIKLATGPQPLYYMAIDGTDDVDSAVFCALLEKHGGWLNALDALDRVPPDGGPEPPRHGDPVHPFLPIYRVPAEGREIAVVCPAGLRGRGQDRFWHGYNVNVTLRNGETITGSYAAAEHSARYMNSLTLRPVVHHSKNLRAFHLYDEMLSDSRPARAPELLYVSSHGWQGGYMAGGLAMDSPYFVVGQAAYDGRGFVGPRWVILAQCSTLNRATWPLWARVLAKSAPHVRGILAYEGTAPGPGGAAALARRFFRAAKSMPLLQAWIEANDPKLKWAAIVHKDAQGDRLQDFGGFRPFKSVATTESTGPYLGFLTSARKGVPIRDAPPPFELLVERRHRGILFDVSPDSIFPNGSFNGVDNYRFTVKAPAGALISRARLRLVHIRTDYSKQFDWDRLFSAHAVPDGTTVADSHTKTISIVPASPKAELWLEVNAGTHLAGLEKAGLEAGHSYFWIRATLELEGRVLRHDFKTKGLWY